MLMSKLACDAEMVKIGFYSMKSILTQYTIFIRRHSIHTIQQNPLKTIKITDIEKSADKKSGTFNHTLTRHETYKSIGRFLLFLLNAVIYLPYFVYEYI